MLYTSEHVIDDPGSIHFDSSIVLMVKCVWRWCSAFIFPDADRKRVLSEFGIVAVRFHGSGLIIRSSQYGRTCRIQLVAVAETHGVGLLPYVEDL